MQVCCQCRSVSNVHSVAYMCTENVSTMTLTPQGALVATITDASASVNRSWQALCSVSANLDSVEPSTGKTLYNMLTLAQSLAKKVTVWFYFDGSNTGPCDATRFPA